MRLFSLNMERSRHLHRILPFICDTKPDVVCLQELTPGDIKLIGAATGLRFCHFIQMAVHPADNQPFGIGIFARTPFLETDCIAYAGSTGAAATFDRSTADTRLATARYALALARLTVGGLEFTVATTHFPWSPEGQVLGFQTAAVQRLADMVWRRSVVLTGDFNAPRGGPIFAAIADVLTDCVPPDIMTSIDPLLHRAGALELMVDGLFSSRDYGVSEVRMHSGLSDHQGLSARIEQV